MQEIIFTRVFPPFAVLPLLARFRLFAAAFYKI
jgi:hypothetical protein